jgi:uncharacterized membrane protein YfcA
LVERTLTAIDVVAILAAGLAAGTINTIVGSGSLITFPTLLALGYPPVIANVSNTVGLVPGSLSGAIGYRRELAGQRTRVIRLGAAAILGGITGSVLLLLLPAEAFGRVVPYLILAACALLALQPRLSWVLARFSREGNQHSTLIVVAVFATAVYGGYFGAAQGVMLIALLAVFLNDDLQRLNALKNVLVMLVNAVAAITFVAIAPVAWEAAALIAVGATIGGQIGAVVGRRFRPDLLRTVVIIVGTLVAARLLIA